MQEKNPIFFSIIVPVYNVQEYLEACAESVLRQDFTEYELILVDDGSTDRSGVLCDALAKRDSRICALHQQNQGASAARNNGTRLARGEYILFLDSDDFYPQTDFLKIIHEKSRDADVVCFNYARYTDRLLKPMLDFPERGNRELGELWLELVKRNAYQSSACIKAVKHSLLTAKNITFETGITGEDIEWSAKIMRAAQTIALAPECVYAYRVRKNSISHSISKEDIDAQYRIINNLIAAEIQGPKLLYDAYYGYAAFQYCTLLINMRLCKPSVDRETRRQIRDLSWLLQYDANRIVKLIHWVYRLMGFEVTCRLLLLYFKLFGK